MYLQKLDKLPVRYELMRIETSFGDTNIIITGLKENPPLVLLHDYFGCAPMALEALLELTHHSRVYAIDIPGLPNLSEEYRTCLNDASYGQWMYEILSRLALRNAILVGISFGGFVAWKTLIFEETRIAKTFLIVPAGIVARVPLQTFRKTHPFEKQKEIKTPLPLLSDLFSEKDEFAEAFLSKIFLYYKMDFPIIPLITEEEALRIKTPVYIVAAKNNLLFPGEKMIERAKNIFISLNQTILLEKSKHLLSPKDYERIAKYILNNL